MQFSAFTRSSSGTTILIKNLTPIENVKKIKYYKDDAVGSFTKREVRWSFNNSYWSAWETLEEDNLGKIKVYPNKYLYLEIRFIQTSIDTGIVTAFSINYKKLTSDQYPIDSGPDILIPESGSACSTVVKTIVETTYVDDADKLDGQHGDFYLWRPNHKGTQPITSITGLSTYLNNLSSEILRLDASLNSAVICILSTVTIAVVGKGLVAETGAPLGAKTCTFLTLELYAMLSGV